MSSNRNIWWPADDRRPADWVWECNAAHCDLAPDEVWVGGLLERPSYADAAPFA